MSSRPVVAGTAMTLDEYLALGEDPPMTRLELSGGRLIVAPSSNFPHTRIQRKLCDRLDAFAAPRRLGVVTMETDVRLGPDTVRRPDVCLFRPGRLRGRDRAALPLLAPDLVIEIVSAHDRRTAIETKIRQYLVAGAAAVWLLDPRRGTAERHASGGAGEMRASFEEPDLLPGLKLALDDIFAPGREEWDGD